MNLNFNKVKNQEVSQTYMEAQNSDQSWMESMCKSLGLNINLVRVLPEMPVTCPESGSVFQDTTELEKIKPKIQAYLVSLCFADIPFFHKLKVVVSLEVPFFQQHLIISCLYVTFQQFS